MTERDTLASAEEAARVALAAAESAGRSVLAGAESTARTALAGAESTGRDVLAGAESTARDTLSVAESAGRDTLAVAESAERDTLASAERVARDMLANAESTARGVLAAAESAGRDVLAEAAVELTAKVSQLIQSVDELHDRAGRARVAARVVASILLALGAASLAYNQSAGNARLAAANARLDAVVAVQSRIRTDTFCPLYEFLTNSESSHEREVYAGGPTAYDAAFAGLRRQRATLQCAAKPPPP